jgi:enoyl-CoA hydratase/carnithine racemase
MSESETLLCSVESGVATLTLNRPQARNSLSLELLQALNAKLARLAADVGVRAVVIAGAGPAFCAGHDLREMREANFAPSLMERVFGECSKVMLAITRLPKPVIAQVHGVATAAGCQLVASCDLAVAAADARFATPGVNIGLFCSTPMVALSRAVGRKQAMQMLLCGELIDAQTALGYGLINEIVAPEGLAERAEALALKLAAKSPLTLSIGKAAFYRQIDMGMEEAYGFATQVMIDNMAAEDAQEGISAFLDKRPPVWQGR